MPSAIPVDYCDLFCLFLQALDGFLVALTTCGNIVYVSDSVSSLIGHLPVSDVAKSPLFAFDPVLNYPSFSNE